MGEDSGIRKPRRKRSTEDWYVEEAWAVEGLLDRIRFAGGIWDPACGMGTILKVAEGRGHNVRGSDLVFRGWRGSGNQDFLEYTPVTSGGADNIICNPPYKLDVEFVNHALTMARFKVAMLLRLGFLAGQERGRWFPNTPLACVLVSSARINMPPGHLLADPDFKREGGEVDFCWFVWDHDWDGDPVVKFMPGPKKHDARKKEGQRNDAQVALPI